MATLNFPTSPVNGQTYTSGGVTWTYNSTYGVWNITSSGPTGYSGSAGYFGSVGYSGSRGIQGFTGSFGITGFTGSFGLIGFTGSFGVTGFTGSKGDQGITGFTGSKGDQGITGFTGSFGITGFTGSQGIQGTIGFTGSQGIQGITGFTGSKGIDGLIGYTGSVGFTGSQGIQGITGFTGSSGVDGLRGYSGSQGSLGFTGSQGIQGITGFTGSSGVDGLRGYSGSQGSLGFTGSQGIQGVIGFTGSSGIDGLRGYSGSVGFTGSAGFTGSVGFTGSKGVDGLLGYTGSFGQIGYTGSSIGLSTNTQIIFNDSGFANGSSNFTFNKSTNVLTVSGGNTVFNSGTLFVDATNDRVGVGTSAPSSKLNVAGDTVISGNADALQIGFNFYGTSQYNFYTDGAADAAKMTIRRGTTSVATFDSGGNVGIGITPTAKFHVAGTIQSQTGSSVAQMSTDGGAAYFTSVGAYPSIFSTNSLERMRIDSGGNVGIGNSPSGTYKLEVTGAVYASSTGSFGGGIIQRVVSIADGTSITINADTTDIATQINTQAAGTLTINAPTGTVSNGEKLMLRIKSTNVQTFSWNAIFTGSTDLALPTATSGSSRTDYLGFQYDSTAIKWHMIAKNFGF